MKNLAKLQIETQRSKAKTKPMASARVARAVPQMRKAIKTITGRKDGGAMTKNPMEKLTSLKNPKAKDRFAEGQGARLEKALDKLLESLPEGSTKDLEKILNRGLKGSKEVLT